MRPYISDEIPEIFSNSEDWVSLGDKWKNAKKEMESAGIDIKKIFKEDLGPALDDYQAAEIAARNVYGAKPAPAENKLLAKAKKALDKAALSRKT